MAPAATEILFDLGLGEKVVGVTEYCSWPPEAKSRTNIGDMLHVNMEIVASLNPDLVLLSNMNESLKGRIEAFGIPVAVVYQDDFAQICDSMIEVGRVCGIPEIARQRVEELRKAVSDLAEANRADGAKRRVLVVVGRDVADTSFRQIFVAGPRSFYENLIAEAGAVNAFTQNVPYANISREGLMRIDPDVIIELVGEHGMTNVASASILEQWSGLADVRAAQNGGVSVIRGDFTLRAGPRYPLILDAFARIIHGGVREISE
jgi:iron complex transport system substrate-binding protein